MTERNIKIKPAKYTIDFENMLDEALEYLREKAPKQAEIMSNKVFEIINILERMPELGTIYNNKLRKFKVGKFRYNIFYKIKQNEIEILGIWHTSRGSEFEE